MGYRRMKKRDLWEIYRRWQAGQAISHIAAGEQRDRKTIRQYVEGFARTRLDARRARHGRAGLLPPGRGTVAGPRRSTSPGQRATRSPPG